MMLSIAEIMWYQW